MANINVNLR